jgi:hypothetical protein
MWALYSNSVKLFLTGRLFRDPLAVFRQWLLGFAFSVIAVMLAVKLGVPLYLSVITVALIAGFLQPFLFKNLKYA